MKKHDWLNKTESPPPPPMGDNKIKKRQAEAFERVAADPGKHWREDGFDEVVCGNGSRCEVRSFTCLGVPPTMECHMTG